MINVLWLSGYVVPDLSPAALHLSDRCAGVGGRGVQVGSEPNHAGVLSRRHQSEYRGAYACAGDDSVG